MTSNTSPTSKAAAAAVDRESQVDAAGAELASVFGDPTIARTAVEDPVFRFFVLWWRPIAFMIAAVLVIVYAFNTFKDVGDRDRAAAGDAFVSVQKAFHEFQTAVEERQAALKEGDPKDDAAKDRRAKVLKSYDEKRQRLEDGLQSLADLRAPYNRLAVLYRALMNREAGDPNAMSGLNPSAWESIGEAKATDRFLAELEALTIARAQLDTEAVGQSRETLKRLAANGLYVHVPAALAVSAIAETEEQRTEALKLLESTLDKNPEQSSLLEDEIERLK